MIHYLTESDIEIFNVIRYEALSHDQEAFGELIEDYKNRSDAVNFNRFTNLISGLKNIIIISVVDTPVGMCGFGISDDDGKTGFLWGMYVSASQRNKGYGRRMLLEAERWIVSHGGHKICAIVAAPNSSAIAFYENCGYEILPQSGTLREGSEVPVHPIKKDLMG